MFSRLYLYNTSQSISEKRITVYCMFYLFFLIQYRGRLAMLTGPTISSVHRVNGTPNLTYNMQ